MTSSPLNLTSLKIKPLAQRRHDLAIDCIQELKPVAASPLMVTLMKPVAECLQQARENGRARIMMMGAHVIRAGVQRYLIDLMERGFIDCLAFNGAGIIHDYARL